MFEHEFRTNSPEVAVLAREEDALVAELVAALKELVPADSTAGVYARARVALAKAGA